MGSRGPVPKPDAQRRGHRAASERAKPVHYSPAGSPPEPPDFGPRGEAYWAAICRFELSRLYAEVEWQGAIVFCSLQDRVAGGEATTAEYKYSEFMANSLLLTTAAQRRAGIDLEPEAPPAAVPDVEEQLKRLAKS